MMCLEDWEDTYLKGNPTAEGENAVFRAYATLTADGLAGNYPEEFNNYFWEMTAI